MGGGDVKLGFLIGLITGFPNVVVAIFLSFLTGAIYSLILILLRRKRFKEVVPFGPFLIFGCYLALFFGKIVINWYLRFN